MSSLRIPKLAISQNGLDPKLQKIKTPPKRNPHQRPASYSALYQTTNSTAKPHKSSTQKRRLLLRRTHDDSTSDDDEDGIDLSDRDNTNGVESNDTDSDHDIAQQQQHIKPRETPSKTKVFTSFASGKRFRAEHELEPKPKRRKLSKPSAEAPQMNGIIVKSAKKRRKKKGPAICEVCEGEIHQDNTSKKYCSESCKEEGKIRNKEKRAEKKKQKQFEKEQAKEQEVKRHKVHLRKNTASKFGEIFKDENAGKNLERRIYKASGGELNDVYSKKVKDLAYNLNQNQELLQKVLTGAVTLKVLSRMRTEELAPKDLVLERIQRDEQFKKENTLQKKMIFGKVIADGQFLVQAEASHVDESPVLEMDDANIAEDKKDKTPSSPTPISSLSTESTVDIMPLTQETVDASLPSILVAKKDVEATPKKEVVATPKKEFNANEMTEILKNCRGKITTERVLDDEPLQIQRDSSEDEEDEENEEDEDDIVMSVLEAPEPPPIPHYLQQNKSKKKRNAWNGSVRKSSNDKPFQVSLYHIGGKDVKLKSVIPKHLQINGRTKFEHISGCLKDLVKITKSKFTVILSAKRDERFKKEYKEIIKECRESKKGFVIDMKQTKAKIKLILLPSFRYKKEERFNVSALQKLWRCSLPKTDDLWVLLTVYTKDTLKEENKHKKNKYVQNAKASGDQKEKEATRTNKEKCEKKYEDKMVSNGNDHKEKCNGLESKRNNNDHENRDKERNKYKHSERDNDRYSDRYRNRDRDRHRERDRERDKDRERNRNRENDRSRETDKDRDTDTIKDKDNDRHYHRDRERNSRKSRDHRHNRHSSNHHTSNHKYS